MKKQGLLLSFLVTLLAVAISCTEPPPPTLAYQDRELLDSLYRMKVDSLKPIFDNLCSSRFDSAVQFKTDSMLKVRTAQIQQALERLRQETTQ